MLYSTLMLMMSSAFLMLRLTPGGSFPRPLSEAEERKYLDAWLQGDLEASEHSGSGGPVQDLSGV